MSNNNYYQIFEKPLQHLGIDDWYSRTNQLCSVANTRRTDAFELRQSSRNLRNETLVATHWDTVQNNTRLANRVAELDRWYAEMGACMERLLKEINLLRSEKSVTENDLDALDVPLTVATECLSMRDSRVCGELTQDDASTELKRELRIVEGNRKMLSDQCQRAWEKLNRLAEIKGKLNTEITHKDEARTCDNQQRTINEDCSNITFKTDAMRNPKNSCTYQGWLEHSKQVKYVAENEMEDSCRMRESLFVAREKAKNTLRTQHECTEHILRKRIFDTQRARNEFEWQIIKTKDEMKRTLQEIQAIESALDVNGKTLRLAETRLENRCQRPGMELCMDDVYNGLCDEIKQLTHTHHQLVDKLNTTKATYNALDAHLTRLECDLKKKQHTLMTDIRALDLRQRLSSGCTEDSSAANRNITLTCLDQETG